MVKKTCIKCKCEKEISLFYFIKRENSFNGNCKSCVNKYNKAWKEKDKIKYLDSCKKYNDSVKEKKKQKYAEDSLYASRIKSKNKERASIRAKSDINFYKRRLVYASLNSAIKNNAKAGKTINALGCSIADLKKHLESRFKDGMSWNNYGRFGWTIDHIKPLSSFDLTNDDQFMKASHYTNLQPLWWQENITKGNK